MDPDLPISLNDGGMPLRLAVIDADGFPHIASLWYHFENDHFYCATHGSAWILPRLRANPRVGFELSVNQPPYKGLRGSGIASVKPLQGDLLERLLDTYLGTHENELSRWLLSRKSEEYVIDIAPEQTSTWDYSARMSDAVEK